MLNGKTKKRLPEAIRTGENDFQENKIFQCRL